MLLFLFSCLGAAVLAGRNVRLLKTMIKDVQSNNFDNQLKSRQNRIEYSNCDIGKCFVGEGNDLLSRISMKTSKNGNSQTLVIQCFMIVHYQQDNKNNNHHITNY